MTYPLAASTDSSASRILWHKALYPAQNRRVRQLNSAFRHHLDQIPLERLRAGNTRSKREKGRLGLKVSENARFLCMAQIAGRRFEILRGFLHILLQEGETSQIVAGPCNARMIPDLLVNVERLEPESSSGL
jgi:hypothetical protein